MRKIDLQSYLTRQLAADTNEPLPFDVRGSLVEILFSKPRNGRELIRRNGLAVKIETWPDDNLLLEDTEYDLVLEGITETQMPGRDYVEFSKRVIEAKAVTVQEKP